MPPGLKCLPRGRFLPDDPSYQDVQWKPLLLTLAYAQALEYWTKVVSPPPTNDCCPLVMSMVEWRQHVGWCITLVSRTSSGI